MSMIKPGDTFIADGIFTDLDGTAQAIVAGMVLTSAVRNVVTSDIYSLTVTPDADQVNNPGVYTVTGDTTDWRPGKYFWDVRFTESDGTSSSTDTVVFVVGVGIA